MKTYIHDLPEIRFITVKPTDIMVLENEADTWKIPVADLQLLFSNDAKIQAVYDELLELINNNKDSDTESISNILITLEEYNNKINSLIESSANIVSRVVTIENNISTLQTDLKNLTDRVTTAESRLDSIDKILDALDKRIAALESDNKTNKEKITKIESKNTQQDASITEINTAIKELKELIESYNGVSTDALNKVEKELRDKITEKYNELLQIIDECHHQTPLIV